MRHLPLLLLLISLPLLAATVWKWRDADGVVHYSDQPVPGAEQVSMEAANTFSAPTTTGGTSQSSAASVAALHYSVDILSPSNEATIANTGGAVMVSARLEPQLAADHHLALYLDGRLVEGYPPQGLGYTLNDVPRGEHTLTLIVLDTRGSRIASSSAVTFYVQQPSLLNPQKRP